MKKITIILITFLLSECLTSCLEVSTKAINWMDTKETEEVLIGTEHLLEDDAITVFLPEVFKQYSLASYQAAVKKTVDEAQFKAEVQRINHLADIEGRLYIFFDENSFSTCTVNTFQYMPISRNDAKQLLGIMRVNSERNLKGTMSTYTKITAKYTGTRENYIFKGVHKIYNSQYDYEYFISTFIVTANKRTICFQILTPSLVYFTPFIEKTKM